MLTGSLVLNTTATSPLTVKAETVDAKVVSLSTTAKKTAKKTAKVYIDGETKTYAKKPYVEGKTVMVPTDAFKSLGATISTKGKVTTITKGKTVVKITTGSKKLTKGKTSYTLPAKVVKDGSTIMVPAEALRKVYGSSTHLIAITATGKKVTIESVRLENVTRGIKVNYGYHHYGVNNQKEYNFVMKRVEAKVAKLSTVALFENAEVEGYLEEYLNGARWDKNTNFEEDKQFYFWHFNDSIGDLVKAGVSKAEVKKIIRLGSIYYDLKGGAKDPLDGKPSSAYHTLYNRLSDCDSDSQLRSAVFDSAGYTTAVFATDSHAFPVIKIKGEWFVAEGAYVKLTAKDRKELLNKKNYRFLSSPTTGTFK